MLYYSVLSSVQTKLATRQLVSVWVLIYYAITFVSTINLTCTSFWFWSNALLWMMMLLLLQSITDNRGVLSSSHLHQLLVTSIYRCATAARYVDNVVTWWEKLAIATEQLYVESLNVGLRGILRDYCNNNNNKNNNKNNIFVTII